MSYSVIYLDGTDGLPFIECSVCKEINRNVIEPVAVFVPKEKEKAYKEKLKNLDKTNIQKELNEFYRNIGWYNKIPNSNTCIFHCNKENRIWIENFKSYKEYATKRDESINNNKSFDENFEIKWNEFLVEEFWKRIRAYRFAVDNESLWDEVNYNWSEFLKKLREIGCAVEEEELNKNKELILFYFNIFCPVNNFNTFDLIKFPSFKKFFYKNKENNFNNYNFNNYISFNRAIFIGNVYFYNTIFNKIGSFIGTKFKEKVVFSEVQFKEKIDFRYAEFNKSSNFRKLKANKGFDFMKAIFNDNVYFKKVIFKEKSDFIPIIGNGEVNFSKVIFSRNAKIFLTGTIGKFVLDNINLTDESKIKIRNLKTVNLSLKNISNSIDEFFFYDIKIIDSKEYKTYLKEENIPIKENFIPELEKESNLSIINSNLNKMKFINCDFAKAKNIHIEDSDITEVKFINTDWGKISEDRICNKLFKEKPKKARETYRQLKFALDNQKDYISANEFFSLEMKAHNNYLKGKSWKEHFQDKILFSINKWTSDFGQSWFRPLIFILIFTLSVTYLSLFKNWDELFQFSYEKVQIFFCYIPALFFVIITIITSNLKKKNIFISIIFIFILLLFIWEKKTFNSFDYIANILNIKTILNKSSGFLIGFKFIYTIYTILLAFLSYQFIIAVRRKVRR
jgi:uncharacterized protein YjbI with pentapeptide repeats